MGAPTRAQELAWPAIRSGEHTLVLAPTGSGKTLAAFLSAIDHVLFDDPPPVGERCRVLYVSPLKALAVDIERNLRAPIAGISEIARQLGAATHTPQIAVRTGDTPGRERRLFGRRPADILITTPESLYLVLTSAAREALRSVRWVIVDEIHAVVGTKRGTHLALSLERLEELTAGRAAPGFQRIGLSATVRPPEVVARFLVGFDDQGRARDVTLADAGSRKRLDLSVAAPQRSGFAQRVAHKATASPQGGVWPAMHDTLLEKIRAHRSTLIFVNNRRLAERLAAALNELAGSEIAQAHHGSIAREQRLQIEENLKCGRLPALVATSSLELGIDMGAIDLVIQIESPPSVSSAMQRIGRAGHQVDAPSNGIILPKHRGDLIACAAVTERMHAGAVEAMRYPANPLDVLAQQTVAMVSMDPLTVDNLERIVRRAAPYRDLPRDLLEDVLDMLSGRYPSHEFTDLRPRVTWDRSDGTLTPRDGSRRVAVGSAGTIPDRGQYGVFLSGVPPAQGRVGELEEIMVFESRVGDVFLLGASSWRIMDITHDRVVVAPAPGVPGRMPFWHGDTPGRPAELGLAMGALVRTLLSMTTQDARELLVRRHDLTAAAADDLLDYLRSQEQAAGAVPDDRTIIVERHRDEMGEWRICVLTPIGSRVLAPWAMAIGAALRERVGIEPDVLWTEDGLVIRYPDAETPPPTEWLLPCAEDVERMVTRQLAFGGGAARRISHGAPVTAVFASHFREAAARALLLPQRRPGKRSPLWLNRKRAADLLNVVGRYPEFPIVLETFRECLRDVFDMPALIELMERAQSGDVRVVTVDTVAPSPFAASLLFSYVANFMYEGDAPMAERRAQALTIDPIRLQQLLGQADLRELLEPGVLDELERGLQRLTDDVRISGADGVHDLLLRLGDLTTEEIAARCAGPASPGEPGAVQSWLDALATRGRAIRVCVGGCSRWIAVEDASRYRDALGVTLPAGLPAAFLEPVDDPLGDLLGRYARTHGPFRTEDAARRLGLGQAVVQGALLGQEETGCVIRGEFRPAGSGVEWCDVGVLRTLRTRSLARLRREVEPVEQAALARFLMDWHGICGAADLERPPLSLQEVIQRLQGASLPASHLEKDILTARLPDYDPRDLDLLLAGGEVIWIGDGRLGSHDGRVRLMLSRDAELLMRAPYPDDDVRRSLSGMQAETCDYLAQAGASFFPAIASALGAMPSEALDAIWELVWKGLVSNDTLRPLRCLLNPRAARRAEAFASRRAGRFRPLPTGGSIAGRPAPPTASGRWSLIAMDRDRVAPEAAALALAEQLVERHGVLTREAVTAEGIAGGFSSLYQALRALEDAGRIRRGYFVEGLGASQFALPEAVERLRKRRKADASGQSARDADVHVHGAATTMLASADPANPYGAALPWPEHEDPRRPARAAGSYTLISDGSAAAWLAPSESRMILFTTERGAVEAALGCIAGALRAGRLEPFVVSRINGLPAQEALYRDVFESSGFIGSSRGIVFRRPSP